MNSGSQEVPFEALCLRFANTLDWRNHPQRRRDVLDTYSDLVNWSRNAGVLTNSIARRLIQAASRHPQAARATLERARNLREAIYQVVSTITAGRRASAAPLELLNTEIAALSMRARLVPRNRRFEWEWAGPEDGLERVMWPITRAAAELLTSDKLARLRECPGEGCGFLFLDATRNRSRRWCDMKVCGNRAKVRRFYKSRKKEKGK